jgi:hypothetical protein
MTKKMFQKIHDLWLFKKTDWRQLQQLSMEKSARKTRLPSGKYWTIRAPGYHTLHIFSSLRIFNSYYDRQNLQVANK